MISRRGFVRRGLIASAVAPFAPAVAALSQRLAPAAQRGAVVVQQSLPETEEATAPVVSVVQTHFLRFGGVPYWSDGLAVLTRNGVVDTITNRSGRIVRFADSMAGDGTFDFLVKRLAGRAYTRLEPNESLHNLASLGIRLENFVYEFGSVLPGK